MLLELVVENYAVVERLRVHFHAGLNLLTGETGSGKSIVVDALGLLLGSRASAEMIRTGAGRARVAGIFEVRDQGALRKILEQAGLEMEEGELLVEREILASGKSRAFVGSRPVSVSLLREIAPFLGDIHGQHDQQLLFLPDAQREMLDAFAGNRELLERTGRLFGEWRASAAELEELERNEQEKLRLLDLWSFQRKEIEGAKLETDEDTALENERRVLQNVQKLQESAGTAYDAVFENPESALALARIAAKRVDELCRIDASLEGLREHLKSAEISLQEVAYTLRDYLAGLEANPGRLEEVETRLEAIAKLKRKYGQSIAEILTFLEEVRGQIASVEHTGERMEALRKEQKRLAGEFEKAAAELTEARKAAARRLEKRVQAELAQLAMERTVFRVDLAEASWSASRRGPSGVPGIGECGRRTAAVREGGVGRRDFAPGAGAEDVPGGSEDGRGADAGVRRGGHRSGWQRGGGRGPAIEEAGGGEPGAVRDAPAADCELRRPSLPGGEAGSGRAHRGGDRGTRCGRADTRGGADVERTEADAGGVEERGAADQDECGVSRGFLKTKRGSLCSISNPARAGRRFPTSDWAAGRGGSGALRR